MVNCLVGLSLLRKSVVRLTDCPVMTITLDRRHKTTTQQQQIKTHVLQEMCLKKKILLIVEQKNLLF